MKKQSRNRYNLEFKKNAVQQYLSGEKTQKEIADELGVNRCVISTWYNAYIQGDLSPKEYL